MISFSRRARRALLSTTAFTSCLLIGTIAHGQDVTIGVNQNSGAINVTAPTGGTVTNSGVITTSTTVGVSFANTSTSSVNRVINNQTGQIVSSLTDAISIFSPGTQSITNSGLISSTAQNANQHGILIIGSATIDNTATGQITYNLGEAVVFTNGGNGTFTVNAGFSELTNAGTITGGTTGVRFSGGGSLTNAQGGRIVASAGTAVSFNAFNVTSGSTPDSINNSGTISGNIGVSHTRTNPFNLTNNTGGTITGTSASAINVLSATGTVNNSGTITSSSGVNGVGVQFNTGAGTITNSGSISGVIGVQLGNGGSVANNQGGTITGTVGNGISVGGATSTITNSGAIRGATNGVFLGAGGTVTNNAGGTISGLTGGVVVSGATGTVANSGTITSTGNAAGVSLTAGGSITNNANSTITGTSGVNLAGGASRSLDNRGNISGSSLGASITNGATILNSGVIAATGTAGSNIGVQIITVGGTNNGTVTNTSITNTGRILGSSNAQVTVSPATGLTNLVGGAGLVVAGSNVTPALDLTLTNAAGAEISGGAFGASLTSGTTASVVNDGLIAATNIGSGLFLGSALRALPTGGTAFVGRVSLVNNTTGVISGAPSASLPTFGEQFNPTIGRLAGQVAVQLRGDGTAGGATLVNSGRITGGAAVITNNGTFTNNATGQISSTGYGVILEDGGTLTNAAGGTISGTTGGIDSELGVNIVNRGTVQTARGIGVTFGYPDLRVAAGPAIVNPNIIAAAFSFDFVVTNSGQIVGGTTSTTTAFNLQNIPAALTTAFGTSEPDELYSSPLGIGVAGLLDNDLAINDSAGVRLPNIGPIVGSAVVTNETGGQIRGGFAGVAIIEDSSFLTPDNPAPFALPPSFSTITNSGTIAASTAGFGVLVNGSATLNNAATGTIAGAAMQTNEGARTIGVLVSNTGLVTNAGTITGDVRLGGLSTLTNSGSITGGVTFTGTGNNTLTLRTGSAIAGPVDAGGGTDALFLEGSGTSAGAFSNFETLTMRGTDWTLTGNSTFGAVNVQSGFLNINGTFTGGPLTLAATTGLRGSGRVVASAVNNTAGVVAPGGAGTIGTLTIQGDYTHGTGARLIVDANDAGAADRLTVTGRTTLQGGIFEVAAVDAAWSVNRTYTVLSSAGGITGTFTTVEKNLPYLTPQLTYSANEVTLALSRKTEDIQKAVIQETTDQQVSVSARKTTVTVESRIDEIVAIAFPMDPTEASSSTNLNGGQRNLAGRPASGLSAGDETGSGWSAWANATPTYADQDLLLPGQANSQRVKGSTWNLFAGADKLVGEKGVLGAVLGYESSDYNLKINDGERKAQGPVIVGYGGVLLADWLYATAQVNHAWFDNDLAEATFGAALVRGKFDSRRTTGSLSMTGRKDTEQFKLSAKLGYLYTKETFEDYTASDGSPVRPENARLGRMTLSGEAAYKGEKVMPYVNVAFERDVNPPKSTGDREGMVYGAGLRMIADTFTADLYGTTQQGRKGEKADSIGLNIRMAF